MNFPRMQNHLFSVTECASVFKQDGSLLKEPFGASWSALQNSQSRADNAVDGHTDRRIQCSKKIQPEKNCKSSKKREALLAS